LISIKEVYSVIYYMIQKPFATPKLMLLIVMQE